jgi:hypothetical protein
MSERNKRIMEVLHRQTAAILGNPESFRKWYREIHGPALRELTGKKAEQMMLVLKLVEPYKSTNDQITSTDFYEHAGKEYRITYLFGEPILEEVIYDCQNVPTL